MAVPWRVSQGQTALHVLSCDGRTIKKGPASPLVLIHALPAPAAPKAGSPWTGSPSPVLAESTAWPSPQTAVREGPLSKKKAGTAPVTQAGWNVAPAAPGAAGRGRSSTKGKAAPKATTHVE